MRILLLCSAYNGLTQRIHTELTARRHDVSVELALDDEMIRQGISLYQPNLIICPFLKQRIPEDLCRNHTCIIVHPGIKGDRGPSSLDWAIQEGVEEWGVTALQATVEMDAGDIWSSSNFKMRRASKNSIYGVEVTEAAVKVVVETVTRFQDGQFRPEPLDYSKPEVKGRLRPMMKQSGRRIDWTTDSVATIIAKINAADGTPGVLDAIEGEEFYLYGAHKEGTLKGIPGAIVAQRYGAICRATIDGTVWISHLKRKDNNGQPCCKLPATMALGNISNTIPEAPIELLHCDASATYKEIWYEEKNEVGYLHFDFYNGAMSTGQCQRLKQAFLEARKRPIKVIVLMGGRAVWSNGIHLNVIEAAQDPATESWCNIQAMDDLIQAILTTESQLTVAAVHGNAGAGGVPLALCCDKVLVREGVIFNPHYKLMGLFGSEYWTYSLPRRVGRAKALELTEGCRAVGMWEALDIGLIDGIIGGYLQDFDAQVADSAEMMASSPKFPLDLEKKSEQRRRDEHIKPLERYRSEELNRMWANFYSPKSDYHRARRDFVYKRLPSATPLRLAQHRQRSPLAEPRANWWDNVKDLLSQLRARALKSY
jgi:putative two-component system protein, hydrogenase maturation factor HypX/HoxX